MFFTRGLVDVTERAGKSSASTVFEKAARRLFGITRLFLHKIMKSNVNAVALCSLYRATWECMEESTLVRTIFAMNRAEIFKAFSVSCLCKISFYALSKLISLIW